MKQLDLFHSYEIFYVTSQAIQRDFDVGRTLIDYMKTHEYNTIWILQGPPNEHVIRIFGFTDEGRDECGDSWNWKSLPDMPSRFYPHITWYS